MTRKQAAWIIGLNAVISTLISVAVALVIIRPAQITLLPSPTMGVAATQPVVVEASPTAERIVHIVQSGDTLSGLALRYDVPEEDIIAANQLENPNFLQLGMELIIPVGGLPQATPTWTPAPTATDTPIPFEPPSADMTATAGAPAGATDTVLPTPPPPTGELRIEISDVLGAGQVDQEQVIISNTGTGRTDLEGWTLSDAEGNIYTFHSVSLWPGGSVTLYTRIGQDNPPTSFYWNKLVAIWSLGETATLKGAEGNVIFTYVVGP